MKDKESQRLFEEAQPLFMLMAYQMLPVSSEFLRTWTAHINVFKTHYQGQFYIDKWQKHGLIIPSLDLADHFRLSPILHLSLLEKYKDEETWRHDTLEFHIDNNVSLDSYAVGILRQEMISYLQNKKYLSSGEDIVQLAQYLEIPLMQQDIDALIVYAMTQLNWVPFFRKLSRIIPSTLYRISIARNRFQLLPPSLLFEKTYFMGDSQFVKDDITDLAYNYQALMDLIRGDLSSAKSRLSSGNICGQLVSAVLRAYSGDNSGALEIFDSIFLYEENDSYVNYDSFCMFVYTHCLINAMNMNQDNLSEIARRRLIWLRADFSKSGKIWMDLLISMSLQIPSNPEVALNNCNSENMCPYDAILTSLVLRYNYSYAQISAPILIEAEEKLEKSEFTLLKLELYHSTQEKNDLYEELRSSLNVVSPVVYGDTRKPLWQTVLDKLMHAYSNVVVPVEKKEPQKRFIYYLKVEKENEDYSFQPVIQKSTDGVHWTERRNISLKNFIMNSDSYSELDKKIALKVRTYENSYLPYTQVYELKGRDVMELLVDHPHVYFSEEDLIPIQIKREEFRIHVTQTDKEFEISSNFPFNCNIHHISVVQEHSHLFKVFRLKNRQRELVRSFRICHIFPNEAESTLTKILDKICHHTVVMCHNCELLSNKIQEIESDSLITARISPLGKGFTVKLFVTPLGIDGPHLVPASGTIDIIASINGKRARTKRDFSKEEEHLSAVKSIIEKSAELDLDNDVYLVPSVSDCLQLLESFYLAKESCRIEWPDGVQLEISSYLDTPDFTLSVNKIRSWFEVDADMVISEDRTISITELLSRLHAGGGRYIQIGKTEYIAISEHLRRILFQLEEIGTTDNKKLRIPQLAFPVLQDFEEQGLEIVGNKEYIKFLQRIRQSAEKKHSIPSGLQGTLRDYQREGFLWMCRLSDWGAGCCLADDMGLGKTVQAITLLLSRRSKGASIVISPVALVKNWENEIKQFAPTLNTHLLNDKKLDRESLFDTLGNRDVVIASYGIMISEFETIGLQEWNTIILDEAHVIKNKDTKIFNLAAELKGDFRVLLSGTPIQNNLSELWPLFHFCNPGLLGTYAEFHKKFISPLEKGENQDLIISSIKKVISPFILRRTKNEVLSELPAKSESVIPIQLSEDEMSLYEAIRKNTLSRLESDELTTVETLAELMKLRQVACNPRLLDPDTHIESSKLTTLLSIVDNIITYKHRALIFSQFTSHLALVKQALDERGTEYLYYDGSLTTRERNRIIKEFQTGYSPLFLISLKAGGFGLNLTAADYVIHLDPWWNPAVEDQASDRAVRIGQKNPVTIIKLVAQHTIEEKILQMHETKRLLVDSLFSGAANSMKLTKEDLLQLLSE